MPPQKKAAAAKPAGLEDKTAKPDADVKDAPKAPKAEATPEPAEREEVRTNSGVLFGYR